MKKKSFIIFILFLLFVVITPILSYLMSRHIIIINRAKNSIFYEIQCMLQNLDDIFFLESDTIFLEQGLYPPDLSFIAERDNLKWNATRSFNHWNGFYYVSGLKTNDPPEMAIIIKQVENVLGNVIGFRILRIDGSNGEISNQNKWLIHEPWRLVRDQFDDEHEYMAFTNRLKIIKTKGIK